MLQFGSYQLTLVLISKEVIKPQTQPPETAQGLWCTRSNLELWPIP